MIVVQRCWTGRDEFLSCLHRCVASGCVALNGWELLSVVKSQPASPPASPEKNGGYWVTRQVTCHRLVEWVSVGSRLVGGFLVCPVMIGAASRPSGLSGQGRLYFWWFLGKQNCISSAGFRGLPQEANPREDSIRASKNQDGL